MSARRVLMTGGSWFDGKTAYVEVPHSNVFNMGDNYTVTAWINLRDYDSYRIIVSKNIQGAGLYDYIHFRVNPDGKLYGRIGNGATQQAVASASTIPLNSWTFVCLRRTPTTLEVWINAALDGSINTTIQALENSDPIRIGKWVIYFFAGMINKVRIYSRARTADEIKAMYERDELITDDLVLYLDFTEGEGSIAYDKSGMGNHATIYGGARWVIKKALRVLPSVR